MTVDAALRAAGLPGGTDLGAVVAEQDTPETPLLFATVSGAHLYGFPSRDSDVDLRGGGFAKRRKRAVGARWTPRRPVSLSAVAGPNAREPVTQP